MREVSDEFFEFPEDYMAAGGGGLVLLGVAASSIRELGLVAVVNGSFIPPRHLSLSLKKQKMQSDTEAIEIHNFSQSSQMGIPD